MSQRVPVSSVCPTLGSAFLLEDPQEIGYKARREAVEEFHRRRNKAVEGEDDTGTNQDLEEANCRKVTFFVFSWFVMLCSCHQLEIPNRPALIRNTHIYSQHVIRTEGGPMGNVLIGTNPNFCFRLIFRFQGLAVEDLQRKSFSVGSDLLQPSVGVQHV